MAGFVQDEVIVVKDKSVEKVDLKKKTANVVNKQSGKFDQYILIIFIFGLFLGSDLKNATLSSIRARALSCGHIVDYNYCVIRRCFF